MKCLKKRLNERPKSAAELEQLLAAVPMEGLPKSYPPGTSRRAPSAAKSTPDAGLRTLSQIVDDVHESADEHDS